MNSFAQTLQDWKQLQQAIQALGLGWQPRNLAPVQAQISRQLCDLESLKPHMATVAASQGWLIQPSHLRTLPANLDKLLAQPVMQAEGVHDGLHWQLHHLGQNRWSWTEVRLASTSAEQATHLAENIAFLAEDKTVGKLGYQRLWRKPAHTEAKPVVELAVFTGFQGASA